MTVYVIGQLEIYDRAAYQEYLDGFLPSFERHGGTLLATSQQDTQVLEGHWETPRTVLMAFPDEAAARGWYDDPDYVALRQIRQRTAKANLVLVQGVNAAGN